MTKWKRKKGKRDYMAIIGGRKVELRRNVVAGALCWDIYVDGQLTGERDELRCRVASRSLDDAKAWAEAELAGAPA